MVAGERSGDLLGAGLIRELRQLLPGARFSGLGGAAMLGEGLDSIADMERLSVMGLVEPLKRLPDLFSLRRELREHFLGQRVDLLVTIDSPDFNLGLARQLRQSGIKTCHYVCPSVWAWRQRRVRKIAASFDHVLCLLPFEQAFLQRHEIDATFVGHPLADRLHADARSAAAASSNSGETTLCLMPGSRDSEVQALLEPFLQTALRCIEAMPGLRLILPAATGAIAARAGDMLGREQYRLLRGQLELRDCSAPGASQQAMRESSLVLLASGTATLEAALLGLPMVVAYRMSAATYALARRLVKVEHVALPNLLLGERVVPELLQEQASPAQLAAEVLALLRDPARLAAIEARFGTLREQLAKGADRMAAHTIRQLIDASE